MSGVSSGKTMRPSCSCGKRVGACLTKLKVAGTIMQTDGLIGEYKGWMLALA